jgi:hypothetical protein
MKDARKLEIKMEVPSVKTHSLLLPLGLIARTDRSQTLGAGSVLP